MKKILLPFIVVVSLLAICYQYQKPTEREKFGAFLERHPYANADRLSPEEINAMPKEDRPNLGWQQDFLRTMDPVLGRPAPERLVPLYNQIIAQRNSLTSVPGAQSSPWIEKGPDNVGGRTRGLMWDPNATSGNKVWAGGVTGGLWYNNDITNAASQWVAVNDFWDNISITSIAADPNNSQIFYVGTGEGWGTGASRGAGIWKTTNGGTTWSQLSATSGFNYVNDIKVRNESGTSAVYAACRGNFYKGQFHGTSANGLQRSTNGGTSWTQVLPNIPGQTSNFVAADIEIAADNRIWIGTTTTSFGGTDRGGGRVLYSDNGTTWTISRTVAGAERVDIACAPNNSNYVYALVEANNMVEEISKTTNKGVSWSTVSEPSDADNGIPNTDFSRGQAWYDLIITVDPNDANTVITGGIDLFRTTNGGTSWTQISKWSNNNNLFNLSCPLVHADQHNILFKAGSSSTALFANDGGIYYTSNLSSAATSSNAIAARNKGYNITQFYACAIHPTAGSEYALAGSQDNGTQKYSTSFSLSTTRATGGDGGFCFIDQDNASTQITSFVYNSYWQSTNGGASFGSRFQNDRTTGRFINPTDYDDNLNILYSARTNSTINRVTNMNATPSIGNFSVTGMNSMASHLRVSEYTNTSTTLFVGTEAGDLFKITNADGSNPVASNIGSSSFPTGSISCVELGANENQIIVTFFNYGVTSVWYTSNGGTSWVSKEGNLPDMPVRWAMFNPTNRSEVILATEIGVWNTNNFATTNPTWTASNSGLANVRVDMLQLRASDNQVLAATYGRGLFTSNGFTVTAPPLANFTPSSARGCINQTITLNDSSTGVPTSWQWSISPSGFTFVNGTSATSQNPQVQFGSTGTYTVALTAGNANGSSTTTEIIDIGGFPLPFSEDFEGTSTNFTASNPDAGIGWAIYNVAGTTPGGKAVGIDFFNYQTTGQRDGLISPLLNFSGYSNVTLTFDYAYKRYDNINRDSMALFISTDCGATFTRIASYKSDVGNNFATGADATSAFTPATSSDWCGNTVIPNCPSINLNAYAGMSEVQIRWEAINGYGNNLYIDNINIVGTGAVAVAPVTNFSANNTSPCVNSPVSFTDLSTNTPTGWSWNITPSTFTYANGTSATSQNPQVNFSAGGTYQVSLTASNTAGNDVETKAGYITVNPSVTPTAVISANTANACQGESITFNATVSNGGSSPVYRWKVNGNNITNATNTYSANNLQNNDVVTMELITNVTCATATNVTSNSVTVTILPNPVKPAVTQSNDSLLTAQLAGLSYQWYNGVNTISGATQFYYVPITNGNYSVETTNSSGCSSKSDGLASNIGLAETSLVKDFELFPNPASNVITLNLSLANAKEIRIKVYNLSGALVLEENISNTNKVNSKLNIENLATGVYLMKIELGQAQVSRRFSKL